ncbi:hypothetical protein BYI23_F000210 (plasmid) [Burkholderia sp. YI23]|nr:hypothetical protein BYI23_F000210 [Burkholderia sp. YI23]
MTPIGFFSIVQKASDAAADTLTVRARARSDLEALRDAYVHELGEIIEGAGSDYPFRAIAPRKSLAAAMAAIVADLDYANFKSEVARRQGAARAQTYHDVWQALRGLESERKRAGPAVHPRCDDAGRRVTIAKPGMATSAASWQQAGAIASVVPDAQMPSHVGTLAIRSWRNPPRSDAQWEALARETLINEPILSPPAGYKRAAGVVIREPDGRVWIVAPTNAFGGYQATFPKGTVDGKPMQATALAEAFEESGLRVRLISHLVDVKRTQSYTRYYLAERLDGNPADMGWESQAVLLVPIGQLATVLNHPNDKPVIEALEKEGM